MRQVICYISLITVGFALVGCGSRELYIFQMIQTTINVPSIYSIKILNLHRKYQMNNRMRRSSSNLKRPLNPIQHHLLKTFRERIHS
jgi:hypothetical protein